MYRFFVFRLVVLLSLLLAFSVSCNNRNIRKELAQMMNSEIKIPHLHHAIFNGKDTVMHFSNETSVRMIAIFDSTFCASCHLPNMKVWNEVISYSKATDSKFEPIFIFSPKQEEIVSLKQSLRENMFEWPFFIDENGDFLKNNPFIPQDSRFHTFLLNSENKIILVGSPINNEDLWSMYKEQIQIQIQINQ